MSFQVYNADRLLQISKTCLLPRVLKELAGRPKYQSRTLTGDYDYEWLCMMEGSRLTASGYPHYSRQQDCTVAELLTGTLYGEYSDEQAIDASSNRGIQMAFAFLVQSPQRKCR